MGEMLFYTEQLERISSSRQQAAHALYVGDYERWPDPSEWEIQDSWDALSMSIEEQLHPGCPDWGCRTATARATRGPLMPARDDGDPSALRRQRLHRP